MREFGCSSFDVQTINNEFRISRLIQGKFYFRIVCQISNEKTKPLIYAYTSTLSYVHAIKGAGHSAQQNKVWSHKNIQIKINKVNMLLESDQTEQTNV